jgi:hypothetical protein
MRAEKYRHILKVLIKAGTKLCFLKEARDQRFNLGLYTLKRK